MCEDCCRRVYFVLVLPSYSTHESFRGDELTWCSLVHTVIVNAHLKTFRKNCYLGYGHFFLLLFKYDSRWWGPCEVLNQHEMFVSSWEFFTNESPADQDTFHSSGQKLISAFHLNRFSSARLYYGFTAFNDLPDVNTCHVEEIWTTSTSFWWACVERTLSYFAQPYFIAF